MRVLGYQSQLTSLQTHVRSLIRKAEQEGEADAAAKVDAPEALEASAQKDAALERALGELRQQVASLMRRKADADKVRRRRRRRPPPPPHGRPFPPAHRWQVELALDEKAELRLLDFVPDGVYEPATIRRLQALDRSAMLDALRQLGVGKVGLRGERTGGHKLLMSNDGELRPSGVVVVVARSGSPISRSASEMFACSTAACSSSCASSVSSAAFSVGLSVALELAIASVPPAAAALQQLTLPPAARAARVRAALVVGRLPAAPVHPMALRRATLGAGELD